MPPDRDIYLGINLVLDTQPISIPPYYMAPAELKKLKEQLQELLGKGFIRPSVFLGGAPLTKSTHFILVMTFYTLEKLAKIYIRDIVCFHVVPASIISDHDTQFTFHFWSNAAFHPQMDGQSERMLRMAPYEALYGRWCRSSAGWFEPGETRLLGRDLVLDAWEKKSYLDRKVHNVAFMEGDKFLHRVSPMKGMMRFLKKGKLTPQYIGQFDILERVDEVAYKLYMPPSLLGVHLVFYILMIQKYHKDQSHVLDFISVQLDENLAYEEESVVILDRQIRELDPAKLLETVAAAMETRGTTAS
ncbi:PREDICTED: uncharacterized protein LOC109214233 [Nicotiana attenuata]|uniref:uncharacterized protein LOC109214233 n=1 Tax=Nicotiana attenuata TaxID=49451 RepID=UPI00090574B2|nr:PREDICTED: uncharacterized protein LOC109214233 [Nicotiana attenuata]